MKFGLIENTMIGAQAGVWKDMSLHDCFFAAPYNRPEQVKIGLVVDEIGHE